MKESSNLTLIEQLESITKSAFKELGHNPNFGALTPSAKGQSADFQCNGAMAAARQVRINPREMASNLLAHMQDKIGSARVSIAGPGFINFVVEDLALNEQVNLLANDPRSGHRPTRHRERIIIDYGGPNAAKAMHVGHLRSAVIGQCLKNILRFQGHEVVGDIHLGDWGLQMGQMITEIARTQPNLPYFDPDLSGPFPETPPFTMDDLLTLYPVASARSNADPLAREAARIATSELQAGRPGYRALWKHFVDVSIADIRNDYDRMGIQFEQWFGESRYQDRLVELSRRLVDMGVAIASEGALVIPVANGSSDPTPPLMLQNSDEGFGYGATDLATIDERVNEFGASTCLYVVDARQSLHFRQVFRAARRSVTAEKPVRFEHLPFGTVNGTDGKPFKTRSGGVMRLAELMQMLTLEAQLRLEEAGIGSELSDQERHKVAELVGLGALKFADLQHDRESDYIFDIARFSKFEGRTGPYLQYTGVRIKSLLSKASAAGLEATPIFIAQPIEREITLTLDRFHFAIERSAELRKPHIFAEHLYSLASFYNQFYHHSRILTEDDRKRRGSWLLLSKAVLAQLELGLSLLGIAIPDRM